MTAAVLFRVLDAVEGKDRRLLLVAVPLMLAILAPAPDDGFVNILPVRTCEHEAVFLPHESRANFKARILISVMKDAGFCCCVEYVDGSIHCHRGVEHHKCTLEKFAGILVGEVVVLDFPRLAFELHHIRRVCADEVDLLAAEQPLVYLRQSGIPTKDAMLSEMPKVSRLSDTRLLQFCIYIEIVLLRLIICREQIGNLRFVKARERYIEVHALQGFHLDAQHFLIPTRIEREAVVCEDVRFLLRFRQMLGKDARHAFHALRLGNGDAPVTCKDAVILVNDDRIDKAKLSQTAAQLVELLLRMCPCVVGIGHELIYGYELHLRCGFVQIFHLTFFLDLSNCSIRSSCGEPLNVVVQFCFTMSKISYQSKLDCFWNACPI